MPIETIRADKSLTLTFRSGRSEEVEIFVSAEDPVQVYAVDEDGLEAFRAGKDFETLGDSVRKKREHRLDVAVSRGRWHLIVYNPNNHAVSVFYEVLT